MTSRSEMGARAQIPYRKLNRTLVRQGKFWVLIAIVLTVAGLVAALTLFTHSVPPFTPSSGVVTTTCSTLVVASNSTANGWVQLGCSATAPALTASVGTATATLAGFGNSGYTGLWIIHGGAPTTSCMVGPTSFVALSPGPTAVSFATAASYNYCLSFSNLTAKLGFTITWS